MDPNETQLILDALENINSSIDTFKHLMWFSLFLIFVCIPSTGQLKKIIESRRK